MVNKLFQGAAVEQKDERPSENAHTLERRIHTTNEKGDNNSEALIAQLNNRVSTKKYLLILRQ